MLIQRWDASLKLRSIELELFPKGTPKNHEIYMDIFHGDAKANRNRHFNSFPFFETALRGRYEPGLVPLTMLQLIFLCFDSLDFEQHVFFVNSMNMCKQYAQYYCEAMMLRQICREDKQTVRYKQNTFFFCESWGQYIFHLFGG